MRADFILAATLAATAAAAPASAADWRLVAAGGAKPDRNAAFVDLESLKRSGREIRAWVRSEWEKPSASGTDGSVRLLSFDCDDKSYKVLAGNFFGGSNSTGDVMKRLTPEFAAPDSVMHAIITRTCDGSYHAIPVADPYGMMRAIWKDMKDPQ